MHPLALGATVEYDEGKYLWSVHTSDLVADDADGTPADLAREGRSRTVSAALAAILAVFREAVREARKL